MYGFNMTFEDLVILLSNRIPISVMRNFLEKQGEYPLGNYEIEKGQSVHSILEITSRRSHRALFLKKSYGLKRQIPGNILGQLAKDYFRHVRCLGNLGLGPLVKNYRLQVNLKGPRPTMSVEQLFFPFGTARQWLESPNAVQILSSGLFCNYLLPLIKNTVPERSIDSPAFVDLTFKNFAVVPINSKTLKLFYLDFFPPRVRNKSGEIKELGYSELHIRSPREIEYRFFNLIGIVHNLLIKSLADMSHSRSLQSTFIQEARFWMDPILRDRFGIEIGSLLDLDFVTAANRFDSEYMRRVECTDDMFIRQ